MRTPAVFDRLQDPLLLALRLYIGWRFMAVGYEKLADVGRTAEFFASVGIPAARAVALLVGVVELVGGALLLVGLFARYAALALSLTMIGALLTADRESLTKAFAEPDAFLAAAPLPFLLVSLVVLAFGAGRLSIDALLANRAREVVADDGVRGGV